MVQLSQQPETLCQCYLTLKAPNVSSKPHTAWDRASQPSPYKSNCAARNDKDCLSRKAQCYCSDKERYFLVEMCKIKCPCWTWQTQIHMLKFTKLMFSFYSRDLFQDTFGQTLIMVKRGVWTQPNILARYSGRQPLSLFICCQKILPTHHCQLGSSNSFRQACGDRCWAFLNMATIQRYNFQSNCFFGFFFTFH